MENYPTSENERVTKNFVVRERMEMILFIRVPSNTK